MIIAIDGTSSSGKSTAAREVGKKLNIPMLSTGSIYRAITLKCINLGIDPKQNAKLKTMLTTTSIECKFESGQNKIFVDRINQNYNDLNSPEVSKLTPSIACKPFVREYVRKIQRQIALSAKHIIIEGRDIGSVVFLNADVKLFIDADVEARAKRRKSDYDKQGKPFNLKEVVAEIQKRDQQDREREHSPLVMTQDCILIDTSNLTIEHVVNKIENIVKEKGFN